MFTFSWRRWWFKVRNLSYSPWKADISGVNWGYSLAESDSSLSKPNPFWFIPDLTVLFSFCITFAAEADNGELKSIAKYQGKKFLRPSLYDDSFKRDLTALWVSVMFHKSIGDTDHHPVTFKHSDLTSFFIVHTPQPGPLMVSTPDKPLGKYLTCVLRKWG